jgi:glutathionylspermidine synthase
MFPNHPHLLRSEWILTDDLKQGGYVKNQLLVVVDIMLLYMMLMEVLFLMKHKENLLMEILFPLPKHDDYYAIFGSWIIHGLFAGFDIREDKKLITDADSPVTVCCIVWR